MRCICLVQSPLQAINAQHAAEYFGCAQVTFVVIKWDKRPNNYRQTVSQLPQDCELITLERDDSSSYNAVNYYASALHRLNRVGADILFIGDVRPYAFTDLAKSLQCPQRVLIDDGTGTLLIHEYLIKTGKYFDLPQSSSQERQTQRELQKKAMDIKIDNNPPYDLFTCFNLEDTALTKVYHQPLTRFEHRYETVNPNQVVIAGGPLVELNKLTISDYQLLLKKMTEDQSLEYLYIPHRNETDDKLKILEREFPIKVQRIDEPLELWLKSKISPPGKLYSVMSTALWHISQAQPQIAVKAFLPSRGAWARGAQKEAWGVAGVSSEESLQVVVNYFKNNIPYEEVDCNDPR